MSALVFNRSVLGVVGAIVILTGCGGGGGGGTSASVNPSLPVAAQFRMNLMNSVVSGSTPSGISFAVTDSTASCIKFPEPFSDDNLAYQGSAERTVQLVDCGTSGWFTVKFHALNVPLTDTTVKWTVSEPGLTENIVEQGGLCVQQTGGTDWKEKIIAKPPGGCPSN